MKRRSIFLLIVLLLLFGTSFSQELMYEDDTPILLRKEMSFGFNLNTSGMGIVWRRGKHVTGTTKRMLEAELVTMKHPKEVKTRLFDDGTPYVFGKLNSLAILRLGYGFQHVLYKKGDRNGLEIRFNYAVGLSLGISKPIYLYIIHRLRSPGEKDSVIPERYDPQNPNHTSNKIKGKAEFSYGLDQLNFHPGGFAKAAFSYEFGRSDRSIRSLETGATFDLYPRTIQLMANSKNNPYYFSLYLAIFLGGKW